MESVSSAHYSSCRVIQISMVLNKAFHWNCQNVQHFFPVYLNIELSLCPGFNDITHGDINHCTITGQSRLSSVIPCLITNCTPGDNDNRANRKHSNASIGGMSSCLPVVYTWAVLAVGFLHNSLPDEAKADA